MALRYKEKLIPFPARFNDKQRKKILKLASDKLQSEAEALRIMVDAYEPK